MTKGNKKPKQRIDLTGKRFGKILVLCAVEGSCTKKSNLKWKVQCDCGVIKEVVGQSIRAGYTTHCGCMLGSKHWQGEGDLSGRYFGQIVAGAKKRDMKCTVTKKYLWNLYKKQLGRCALSGLDLKLERKFKDHAKQTASLDRIDSSKGYVPGNVQWVHKHINNMKQDYSEQTFLEYVKLIAKNKQL